MFLTLNAIGRFLQILGALLPIGGLVGGALLGAATSPSSSLPGAAIALAIAYWVIGILTGVVVYGFGGFLRVQVSIARDTRRSADALEWLARRQAFLEIPNDTRQLPRTE